jgi:putative hemolysin
MNKRLWYMTLFLLFAVILAGCTATGGMAEPAAEGATEGQAPTGAAADYCTENGGVVETRYPFYDTNSDNPLQLSGSLGVCTFTADDGSRITVALDTLYTDQPTLAALAYRAMTPLEPGQPSANPSSIYCTQLGGTDSFGGVSAVSGGWGLEAAADAIALCVFPDLSVIDSWGITYHSDGTIRGADLTDLIRYRP